VSCDLEALAGKLERRLAEAQAKDRMPGPSAALASGGDIVWSQAIGLADVEASRAATVDDQYRIGSITKVITAICIMQLRDEGKLDLDDPLSAHISESTHRGPTIRRMLSHLSGLQREPVGDVWVTMVMPSMADVVASLGDAELVLKPGEHWHYSNLAFGLLGEVVARLGGMPYTDYVDEKVIGPLGLTRDKPRLPRVMEALPQSRPAVGFWRADALRTLEGADRTEQLGVPARGSKARPNLLRMRCHAK